MAECDNVFRDLGIAFDPIEQDAMVNTIWRIYGRDRIYAKWLILCWFDTTYGHWEGTRFNQGQSRQAMSAWLERSRYATFEEFLDRRNDEETRPEQPATAEPKPANH